MKKILERNSNIEFLRIIAIVMIIGYHYVVHGYFSDGEGLNRTILDIISIGGKIGVNIFCIIMGYYGIRSDKVSTEKVIKIELQVLFYSCLGLLIAAIMNFKAINLKSIVLTLFPMITEHYWFFTAYIIVYILSAFLNKALISIDREEYIRLLVVCYVIWAFIPFFTARQSRGMFWNQLIWFFVMYMTGAFMRLHPLRISCKVYNISILIGFMGITLSFVLLEMLSRKIDVIEGHTTYFRWSNSPFSILASISLFGAAISRKEKRKAIINIIAGTTLGIYLLHENVFIQELLWGKWFNGVQISSPGLLIINFLLSMCFVMCSGVVIELLRKQIENTLTNPVSAISKKIDLYINNYLKWIGDHI